MTGRPSAPSSRRRCRVCERNNFQNCSRHCIFRPRLNSPIWRYPDGSRRPRGEIQDRIHQPEEWRRFHDLNRIREDDPRAADQMAAMVGPAISARSYPQLADDSNLFIIFLLGWSADTAIGPRKQEYEEGLRQRIRERYARANPASQIQNDPNFTRWLSGLLDTVNAVYGQTRPGGDQLAASRQRFPKADLCNAVENVTNPGAGTTTAAAAAAAAGSGVLDERVAPNDPTVFEESIDLDLSFLSDDEIWDILSDL